MTNPYLEQCKAVAASVDAEALGDMGSGAYGASGGGFTFRRLGILPLTEGRESDYYAGLKIPRSPDENAMARVRSEVSFAGAVSSLVPEIMPQLPGFINLVQVEGSTASAVLTEDTSANGAYQVRSIPASQQVRGMFVRAFQTGLLTSNILDDNEYNNTVAFDVDGTERLLDFTPPPVKPRIITRHPAYGDANIDTIKALPDITVVISQDSQLGQSLTRKY